jgi:hypothetical protein
MAQDYIMRLAQQIAMVIAAIITKRRAGQMDEARQEIEANCLQSIGLTLDVVKKLSPEAIAELLRQAGANRIYRSMLLAELLIQDAEILEARGAAPGATFGYLHAFCLLWDLYPVLSREEQAIYRPKLDALAAKLEDLPANPFTTERLQAYRRHIAPVVQS